MKFRLSGLGGHNESREVTFVAMTGLRIDMHEA